MKNNKIFVLLPDGIGLRNFAYSDFYELGISNEFDVVFWNNTPFELTDLGFNEIKITNSKNNPLTDVFKNARKQIELNLNIKRSSDLVYDTYRFPFSYNNIKSAIKSATTRLLTKVYSSENGLKTVRNKIISSERKTLFYKESLATLKKESPALVFCTNQRSSSAIAPIVAAQDLGIPTATFIFSWDNLPKATMVVETDYYFVWSEHMKLELLHYYPYIENERVFVTGTPQFESLYNISKILSKESFFEKYNLDSTKKYICYSGDDITTSPNDPIYLEDTAKAVIALNKKGHQLGVIFRRCPVDFSNRFDTVLEKYKEIIVVIEPKWEKIGDNWNSVLPTKADMFLQLNTIAHTEMVLNLGSSMVFDYVAFGKPCAYICYDIPNAYEKNRSVADIYDFVHFRSMPSKNAVLWIKSPEALAEIILQGIEQPIEAVRNAQEWFEKINLHPSEDASMRILSEISQIID
jgi:hypothetical protein